MEYSVMNMKAVDTECPLLKEIIVCIGPTCDVLEIIKPIYNFKASS